MVTNIHSVLWGKLLINIGINPLTAIMKVKNGQLLNYPSLLDILHEAVTEGCTVAKKLGIEIPFPDPVEKVKNVCAATSNNFSSMLQDILAHRKTEIEYINGSVVKYGKKALVPTPVNRILVGIVSSIEKLGLSQK